MVTGATYQKELLFKDSEDLISLQDLLFELAERYGWDLQAWSLFANHYHFIAKSPQDPSTLKNFITYLHSMSGKQLNQRYDRKGSMVWYQYWDSHITFEKSYYPRLNYVMQNPVKHKLVTNAEDYPWCSANWFAKNTSQGYFRTVTSFKCEKLNIFDDF